MGFYERYLLPQIIHLACSQKPHMRQRDKVVPAAEGRVLEIGMGTGLNLPYYNREKISHLWGMEPAQHMHKRAAEAARAVGLEVEFLGLPGEEIPLADNSVDTIVTTYTLCTIPDTQKAFQQMARVLKPGGSLLFCEHGAAPDDSVRKWQDRVNPLWKKLGGGCHLNRVIPDLLYQGGFQISGMETMYIPGWRPASFNYWGRAINPP